MKLSVVIPTLDESDYIESCLEAVRSEHSGEVIVVDGGSADGTTIKAMPYRTKIFTAPRGLASQLNEGAKYATGEVVLFLCADCVLKPGWLSAIRQAMRSPYVVGGGFRLELENSAWWTKWVSFGGNFRSEAASMALPDEGLFVRSATFKKLGGFSESSLIPHANLCLRLKQVGEFVRLSTSIVSSPRKWKERGVVKTCVEHMKSYQCYLLREGASPLH